jgi:asparagine synthase (glutamine-hydrolysing)
MSGIAGLLATESFTAAGASLAAPFGTMMAALRHRGRDLAGTWEREGCALGVLGSRGEGTSPESYAQRQPLEDEASGRVLVWDGRLDNREELLDLLARPGERLSDAEIVLRAFARWGQDCVPRLLGDFAWALWDLRRRTLFAARDPLGLRPFFYAAGSGFFAFASEVNALLDLPGISREPDEVMLGDFLLGWSDFSDPERTFHRHVRRLLPAHHMFWTAEGFEQRRYWRVDPERRLRYQRREEYGEQFGELFGKAVACRAISPAPVAVFLSGGLDSGAVLSAAARAAGGQALRAYTIGVPGTQDESDRAAGAARELGVPFERLPFLSANPLEGLGTQLARQGSPFLQEGWTEESRLLACAAAGGARVVLTGDGGDELFNSPEAYVADLLRAGSVAQCLRVLGTLAHYHQKTSPELLQQSLRLLVPAGVIGLWRRLKWRRPPPWIEPRFAERTGLLRRIQSTAELLPFGSLCAALDYSALTRGRAVALLEQQEWAASQHGIEYRQPFYDRRLIEFLFAIPWERKSEDGRPKSLLLGVPGLVPSCLGDLREKADYGGLIESCLRREGGESLRRVFRPLDTEVSRYVVVDRAAGMMESFLGGHDGTQRTVWLLACFFLWIQQGRLGITRASVLEGCCSEDGVQEAHFRSTGKTVFRAP